MEQNKTYNLSQIIISIVCILFFLLIGYAIFHYILNNREQDKQNTQNIYTGVTNNPPKASYSDPYYKFLSPQPLSSKEKTIPYDYPYESCGTLISKYPAAGSIEVGLGPMHVLAVQACQLNNPPSVPNDYSFRIYACENKSYPTGAVPTPMYAHTTLAFTCR